MPSPDKQLYEFAIFLRDAGSRILLKAGTPVRLTPRALKTLLVLVRNGVQVDKKDQFLKEVWSNSFVQEGRLSRSVHTSIYEIYIMITR